MKKIHQLPHHVVSKIAAGEVIERPVFAVKELVENAIDAGANSITINIEESGLKRITVIDNGEGMTSEDLLESFKPHTTSKIAETDDLSHIKTLGFRGEALSSIASISWMTINSRVSAQSSGLSIYVKNGNIEKKSPIGMPVGTTVTIEQLFHSLPVRKKFLGSSRTEFRHTIDLITNYALSYPQIHFHLIHNKRTIFDLSATDESLLRVEKLLGKDIYSQLIPISYRNSYISISGFLAKPSLTAHTPNKQFLFINNRSIADKGISLTIKSAYGILLPSNLYPICILYFSLPYEMVDVNVHPRKEHVKFADTALLYDSITQAVKQTLSHYDLAYTSGFDFLSLRDGINSTDTYAGRLLKERKLPWELSQKIEADYNKILQIQNVYIFVAASRGFFLIDQHAAHERILYEQFLVEFQKEKKERNVFHFHKPGTFDLSLSETETLKENIHMLKEFGWDIEHFKGTTFIISALPVLFQDRDYVSLLREILDDFQENKKQEIDTMSRRIIAYLACHAAVKAGDPLTKKQMKELIEQLEKTQNNSTCPHGRPTRITVDLEEIHRLFKRS